jgi:protein phosphatase 2C family protein 2/3
LIPKEVLKYDNHGRTPQRRLFSGVYDGHGGDACSEFLAQKFHECLANHPEIVSDPELAIKETWKSMDTRFLAHQMGRTPFVRPADKPRKKKTSKGGSTCTICLIEGNTCFIASIGDSSAAIFTKAGTSAKIGPVQNTSNVEEVRRVELAGGKVKAQSAEVRTLFCFRRKHEGPPRINPGGLLVTRTFGDFHAKLEKYGGLDGVILSDYTEIFKIQLDDTVEQIALCSDGIWDGIQEQDVRIAINKAVMSAKDSRSSSKDPSDVFLDAALEVIETSKMSSFWEKNSVPVDNTTVVLMHFQTQASLDRFGKI